jgi:hypothetical protein
MSMLGIFLLSASFHALAAAEDDVEVIPPLVQLLVPEGVLLGDDLEEPAGSARALPTPVPHSPAKPGAYIIRWENYRTLIVVDGSSGLIRPAWIVTMSTAPEQIATQRGPVVLAKGQVVVAYRGQAFRDKEGVLHVDAGRAHLVGPMAKAWSPDSFSIGEDRMVSTQDDNPEHPPNAGEVEKSVFAETHKEEYRQLLLMAQAVIEGNI